MANIFYGRRREWEVEAREGGGKCKQEKGVETVSRRREWEVRERKRKK